MSPATLHAPMKVEFDYTRSLGPVLSAFMTGLRDRQVVGGHTSDGRVVVPPPEFDPLTHEALTEFVPVADTGTVQTWAWVSAPVADQPLSHPFAFALVLLDGADTPILHAVDAGSPAAMSTGMRVRVRWADETIGVITDIACFEPLPAVPSVSTSGASAPCSTSGSLPPAVDVETPPPVEQRAPASDVETPPPVPPVSTSGASAPYSTSGSLPPAVDVETPPAVPPVSTSGASAPYSTSGSLPPATDIETPPAVPPVSTSGASAPCSTSGSLPPATDVETPVTTTPVTGIVTPVRLAYDYAASPEESKFFRALAEGRLVGQRCPTCHKVYVPPRGACPVDGVPTTDEVELPDRGTVTTFCIVNVPFLGQAITPPYVSAYVLLDGADIAFLHLILDVDAADVRMGMRVEAVWKPREEWGTTIANISHFRPTGEPDADFAAYRQHL